jgi:oligogalacturonide transport system substrate-binding protein
MNKKILLTTAVAGLSLFTACGENKEAKTSAEKKNVNLRISWWGGEDRHKRTLDAIKLFEEKYPNIKVKAEYSGWQGHQDKITTQIVGNTAPDLMQINWNWIQIFSKNGNGFYDLNKLASTIDLDNYDKKLLEQNAVNGKLNAIPVGISGRTFYYNKTTYDKAGLDIPKSFNDMIEAGKIFKAKLGPDYYAFDVDQNGAFLLMIYKLEQETGIPFIVDNKVAYTVDQLEEAAHFYTNLVNEGTIPSLSVRMAAGNIPLDQHPSWIQGKYAGTYEWDSSAQKWQDSIGEEQELVVGEFPTDFGSNQSAFNKISMAFAVNKNTKYPEEAALLLNFLVSDKEAVKTLGMSRGVASNKAAINTLQDEGLAKGLMLEANNKIMNFAGNPISPMLEHKKLNTEHRNLVEKLGYGQINERQFAEELVSVTNEFLAKEAK